MAVRTGFLVTLICALAGSGAQAQDTSYTIGFAPGTTCAEVQERIERGGGGGDELRPPAPPPGVQARAPAAKSPGPWGSVVERRSFRPGFPNIRYSCDGNANVRSQDVDITFDTEQSALAEYAKYAKQLRAGLGEPCFDSDALNEQQRKLVFETSGDLVIARYRQRLEWRGPAATTVLQMTSRQSGKSWWVEIITVDSRVRNDDMREPERKVRALGTCDPVVQLPSVLASDDARAVLTKWFAHVRERGYPVTVDFLASQEKQRLHSVALELVRRAAGTPSEGLLRGLAGDGIPTDEIHATIKQSTPDAWLRDLLNSRFRGPDGLFRYSGMEILGTIPEGDITHVIARMRFDSSNGEIAAVQSFAFKRSGQRLEMLLPSELQALELGFRVMTHTLVTTP